MNSLVSPFFADMMLWLIYLMVAAALGVTAYAVWHGLHNSRKGEDIINGVPAGKIGWCVVVGLAVCLFVTFLAGSTHPVLTNGVRFADSLWLRLADMFIYTSILLIIACFVSTIVSRFRS